MTAALPECSVPSVDSDAPVPYSLTPAADALPRRVTVDVRGQAVTVDCPPWCVASHAETLVALSDLCHEGEPVALAAPTYSAGQPRTVDVLGARVVQYPFSTGPDARPLLALDANDDGETAELPAGAALAFLDQMAAHIERIRRQVRHLTPADEPLIGPAARHMGARLRATGDRPEPQVPQCARCGSRRGPWRPTGERYPSGAQVLVCAEPCQGGAQ